MDNTNKGAGWNKVSAKGVKYISCKINIEGKDYNFSMFINNKKNAEKHPDWNIILSDKKNSNNVNQTFNKPEKNDESFPWNSSNKDKDIPF